MESLFISRCTVGNGEGDAHGTLGSAENRFYAGRVKGDIGCQYGDVGGFKQRVAAQHRQ